MQLPERKANPTPQDIAEISGWGLDAVSAYFKAARNVTTKQLYDQFYDNLRVGELREQNESLKTEVARAKDAANAPLKIKISEKGALSIYGLGRFPFTLYKSQWERLLTFVPSIAQFIQDHGADLKDKAPKGETAAPPQSNAA